MAKKYNNKNRIDMINKKFNENIREFLKQSYINIIMTLDYSTYKVSSNGKGSIGSITMDNGKEYHVSEVVYDQCTKGVVFSLLPNDDIIDELWVDELNCGRFTLNELISMMKFLLAYFKTGKVYGFDEETHKSVGVIKINDTNRVSYRGNARIIESAVKALSKVKDDFVKIS